MTTRQSQNLYRKQPEIIEERFGEIKSVRRHRDDQVISVGMDTKSGGKILSIKVDTSAVGNMYAEMGAPGKFTAIAAIVTS